MELVSHQQGGAPFPHQHALQQQQHKGELAAGAAAINWGAGSSSTWRAQGRASSVARPPARSAAAPGPMGSRHAHQHAPDAAAAHARDQDQGASSSALGAFGADPVCAAPCPPAAAEALGALLFEALNEPHTAAALAGVLSTLAAVGAPASAATASTVAPPGLQHAAAPRSSAPVEAEGDAGQLQQQVQHMISQLNTLDAVCAAGSSNPRGGGAAAAPAAVLGLAAPGYYVLGSSIWGVQHAPPSSLSSTSGVAFAGVPASSTLFGASAPIGCSAAIWQHSGAPPLAHSGSARGGGLPAASCWGSQPDAWAHAAASFSRSSSDASLQRSTSNGSTSSSGKSSSDKPPAGTSSGSSSSGNTTSSKSRHSRVRSDRDAPAEVWLAKCQPRWAKGGGWDPRAAVVASAATGQAASSNGIGGFVRMQDGTPPAAAAAAAGTPGSSARGTGAFVPPAVRAAIEARAAAGAGGAA